MTRQRRPRLLRGGQLGTDPAGRRPLDDVEANERPHDDAARLGLTDAKESADISGNARQPILVEVAGQAALADDRPRQRSLVWLALVARGYRFALCPSRCDE